MEIISSVKVFSGTLQRVKHFSQVTQCEMTFSIFLPEVLDNQKVPVLYWLSGLTCTDENFCQKAGAFQSAQKYGLAIVCPDTSPRNIDVPGQDESYDFGSGAGFYVDAIRQPWAVNYQMYSYVTKELPNGVEKNFPVSDVRSIAGHSMGGHGAIICALKNPEKYVSASAFAPILNPSQCPWGVKAFSGYLGEDQSLWYAYDSTELIKNARDPIPLLIDQGLDDQFLEEQLLPGSFIKAAKEKNFPLIYRDHPGYDHSYYFISTFIDDHIKHHVACMV